MDIKWIRSPDKGKGRKGYRPEAIVIHIMDGTLAGTDRYRIEWNGDFPDGSSAYACFADEVKIGLRS